MFEKLLQSERFHSVEIDVDEFRKMVEDMVADTHPGRSIKDLEVDDDGVVITLDNDDQVEIGVDWNEFIIR